MNFNLSKFKKVSEDGSKAILQHPAGHRITIAKKPLSKAMHEELASLPMHFADNEEEVPTIPWASSEEKDAPISSDAKEVASSEETKAEEKTPAPTPSTITINTGIPPAATASDEPNASYEPAPQVEPQGPISSPAASPTQAAPNPYANDPYGAKASTDIYNQGVQGIAGGNGQPSSFEQEASAQDVQNEAKAKILEQSARAQQAQLLKTQAEHQEIHDEVQNVAKDIKSGAIKPNHYLDSMTTGQRVRTAIGLFLGGLGAGLTHTRNDNLDFINDQIHNDVQAQAQNLQSKNNLVSAFVSQGHNVNEAQMLAEASLKSSFADQAEAAALKSGNPLLMARAQQAKNLWLTQNAQNIGNMVARKNMLSEPLNGASQIQPEIKAQYLIQDPKDRTAALKEIGTAKELNGLYQDTMANYDDIHNQFLNGILSPKRTDQDRKIFIGKIQKMTEGRYNQEAAMNLADAIYPSHFQTSATSSHQRANIPKLFKSLIETPTLVGHGIDIPFGQHGPYDEYGNKRVMEGKPK